MHTSVHMNRSLDISAIWNDRKVSFGANFTAIAILVSNDTHFSIQ